jgi:hypothetical protein
MPDDRVEASLSTRNLGLNADPTRIDVLLRQRAQNEKINRPPPAESFSSILAKKHQQPAPAVKEKKRAALPKKGPKPQLAPSTMRRVSERNEDVVIKG